ncbi:ATP-dependent protease [Iodidimonas nitroreducens]|uniref:ATP-dependent protease n=1 Tax=Iodidimonas nitroreducens TaxID=1236968 RepID=A0A5A7N3W1_9PROT|nr:LON peptidase substrate-binding domain-containing protein [Iodidimonas nitroreducens]GAK34839.1 Lon protease [alpha proteobacterium Q-1]GER02434.1 ATP-dependent protease [Iodidimonas nitroreducens]
MAESVSPSEEQLPTVIPVFPLLGALLLPRGEMPLNIFETRYVQMVRDAMGSDRIIGMVQPRSTPQSIAGGQGNDGAGLYEIGCAGRICSFAETDDGRFLISLKGVSRFRIEEELSSLTPYRQMKVDYGDFEEDRAIPARRAGVDRDALLGSLTRFLEQRGLNAEWSSIEKAPDELLVNSLAMICPFEPAEKQALLEARSLTERTQTMITLMEFSLADPTIDEDDDRPPQMPN